ncbi:MAG: glycoside hydrolase family 65 protein [Ktedonobacteraceae bacterium]|nr:glycoside hydrolase family 65 protein [Ktedonobacteraceae bacterium]
MNLWQISEDTFNPETKHMRSQETVYSVGNGYFCTRGTFDEGYPRATPATLLFGVFDAVAIAKEELANAPDWTSLGLIINGERFRLDKGKILNYYRMLDMQEGILRRTIHWETPTGIRIKIYSERVASLADEHVGVVLYRVTNDSSSDLDIALWTNFNTAVGNYDLMHWETVDQGFEGEVMWLQSETKKTKVQLAQTMSLTTTLPEYRTEYLSSYIAPSIRLYGKLAAGATIEAEKLVVMYTTRDNVEPVPTALTHHRKLLNTTTGEATQGLIYDQLLVKHKEAWQQFWQEADVIIEGDEKSQLAIRYNIYQLRINASAHDDRYSIAAKGMTGFGYRGHIFHDTEIFMLPFFTYVLPDFARNLLLYRYHLLPAARKKAASNGYEGAQYPWESTLDGEETTPSSIIHPETGEVIPVLNGFIEYHISASVAHAVQAYWEVTGDDAFMQNYGAEIVLSTATFWGSRVEKATDGTYEITNVIGPDEWHEHVNNNAFTNYMARQNILDAIKDLHWLQTTAPAKARDLVQQLNLTDERMKHWQDVIEKLRIPQDPQTKVFEQFDGFFQLEELDQEQFKGRKDSYQGILGIHAIQKYRIVKQADVLMLLTVLSQNFDLETKRANWDYYFPITDHDYGSSLTPAFHVILACELGLGDAAYKQYVLGGLVDLENLRGNTPEGIHTACSGAVWQAAIFGFAGLKVTDEGYTTNPSWPSDWTRLAFKIRHKGELISIDLKK